VLPTEQEENPVAKYKVKYNQAVWETTTFWAELPDVFPVGYTDPGEYIRDHVSELLEEIPPDALFVDHSGDVGDSDVEVFDEDGRKILDFEGSKLAPRGDDDRTRMTMAWTMSDSDDLDGVLRVMFERDPRGIGVPAGAVAREAAARLADFELVVATHRTTPPVAAQVLVRIDDDQVDSGKVREVVEDSPSGRRP
jgi:hypothetical protein